MAKEREVKDLSIVEIMINVVEEYVNNLINEVEKEIKGENKDE